MRTNPFDREAIRQARAEDAVYLDSTDTSAEMAQETHWLKLEWAPREDRCDRCGAQMQRRQVDLRLSSGQVILRGATWYNCRSPGCGQTRFVPTTTLFAEEFGHLGKRPFTTGTFPDGRTALPHYSVQLREDRMSYDTAPTALGSPLLTIRGVFDGRDFRALPTESLPAVQYDVPVAIVFLEDTLAGVSEPPTEPQLASAQFGVDKDEQRRWFDHLFTRLSIKGTPIGAEMLQQRMRETELDSTELSRGIIEAREE